MFISTTVVHFTEYWLMCLLKEKQKNQLSFFRQLWTSVRFSFRLIPSMSNEMMRRYWFPSRWHWSEFRVKVSLSEVLSPLPTHCRRVWLNNGDAISFYFRSKISKWCSSLSASFSFLSAWRSSRICIVNDHLMVHGIIVINRIIIWPFYSY